MYSKRSLSIVLMIAFILLASSVYAVSRFGHIRPLVDSTYDLGEQNFMWSECWCDEMHVNPYLSSEGHLYLSSSASNKDIYFRQGTTTRMRIRSTGVIFYKELRSSGTGIDLGDPNYRWRDLFVYDDSFLGNYNFNVSSTGDLTSTGWINTTKGRHLGDSVKDYYGDDDDICQYWDGTSFIITDQC